MPMRCAGETAVLRDFQLLHVHQLDGPAVFRLRQQAKLARVAEETSTPCHACSILEAP